MAKKLQRIDLAKAVREAVFSATAAGGAKLTEQELATRFGVSRTPIRDVLRDLQKDGLIERRQKSGVSLRMPSPKELAEVYDLRAVLEGYAIRLAVDNTTPADAKYLLALAKQFTRSRKLGDMPKCEQVNIDFHQKIVAMAGNDLLASMIARFDIIGRAFRLTHPFCLDERKMKTPYPHELIVEKLVAGDPDECEKLMRGHIRRAKNILIEKLLGMKLDLPDEL